MKFFILIRIRIKRSIFTENRIGLKKVSLSRPKAKKVTEL